MHVWLVLCVCAFSILVQFSVHACQALFASPTFSCCFVSHQNTTMVSSSCPLLWSSCILQPNVYSRSSVIELIYICMVHSLSQKNNTLRLLSISTVEMQEKKIEIKITRLIPCRITIISNMPMNHILFKWRENRSQNKYMFVEMMTHYVCLARTYTSTLSGPIFMNISTNYDRDQLVSLE